MGAADPTRIDGIEVTTALAVVSEVGADLSRFPSDKHFSSWLGLCPGTRITGGNVMSGEPQRCANRAAEASLAVVHAAPRCSARLCSTGGLLRQVWRMAGRRARRRAQSEPEKPARRKNFSSFAFFHVATCPGI